MEETKKRREKLSEKALEAKLYGIHKYNLMKNVRKVLFGLLKEKELIKNLSTMFIKIIALFLVLRVIIKQFRVRKIIEFLFLEEKRIL